jgi:RNA polymerase sigma factor (sigma-70 family)
LNLNPKHDTRKETLEQLKAIVYGAVKDVYSDYYRQLTRREEKAAEYRQRDPAPAEPLDPTDGIEVREIKTKLLEALSLLSTNCRELLYLHYLKDLQYHEIAQATETLLATVKTRVYRCKAELRKIVEERYPELVPD